MSEVYPDIKTLPQFERLIQPLNPVELNTMKSELVNNPNSRVIQTWHGNHLIDQAKYTCCQLLNLPVEIKELYFEDWLYAAMYICTDQLQNPHLTDEYKKYIIGQYLHYKITLGERTANRGIKHVCATEIAKELFISAGTVLKYCTFSEAMNAVFDQDLEFAQKILMNKLRISHENVIELSHLKPEEIRVVASAVSRDKVDHISLTYIRNEVKWSYIQQPKSTTTKQEKIPKKYNKSPAIRQMPEYNPDSEVNSLCMTIEFWISTIQRVSSSDNFSKITPKASLQLMKKLSFLEHTVTAVQESLVERTNNG